MLRARMRGVKLKLLGPCLFAAFLMVLGGCYWSRYPELMETHLVLLEEFSAKLEHVARSDAGVPIESLPEFVYPLERARDFARIAAQRYPDRASLREFRMALDRYAVLVDDPAELLQPGAAERIARGREALQLAIRATRIELEREANA